MSEFFRETHYPTHVWAAVAAAAMLAVLSGVYLWFQDGQTSQRQEQAAFDQAAVQFDPAANPTPGAQPAPAR